MSEQHPPEVLSSLPRTRPHRRSDKRGARQEGAAPATHEPGAPTTTGEGDAAPVAHADEAEQRAASTAAAVEPAAATIRQPCAPHTIPAEPGAEKAPPPSTAARPAAEERKRVPLRPDGQRVAAQKAAKPPAPEARPDLFGTAVQAAAEIAEIGLSATARAIRSAISRLPRP
jgi:hypothetical protein